jgi:hypothetical protein
VEDLTLREAVKRYSVSHGTLALRLRVGEIPSRRVRGPRGPEWRVTTTDLEAAGYQPRDDDVSDDDLTPEARRALQALQKAINKQRRRLAQETQSLQEMEQQLTDLRKQMPKRAGSRRGRPSP